MEVDSKVDLGPLLNKSAKRTRDLFTLNYAQAYDDPASQRVRLSAKISDEYKYSRELPAALVAQQKKAAEAAKEAKKQREEIPPPSAVGDLIDGISAQQSEKSASTSQALTLRTKNAFPDMPEGSGVGSSLVRRSTPKFVRPTWHAPWKLMRVISGHLGWVRSVAMEPGNEWFATGAGDRTIKLWDLASGRLKLTLTGHIATVRGLAVSPRHPYLFSCGEDKQVKCWDLESNKVIRHYHGHLSGVYALALHPTLDVLVTTGRDAVARVWDMRTKQCVHVMSGHTSTVSAVKCQEADPQVITGSMDSTVRLWDLAAGKSMATLTHHKKSVRALAVHPTEFSFASGSADNIKGWKCPEGTFIQNYDSQQAIINTLSLNSDNVLFGGADNGSMGFYDWKSGYRFQTLETVVQPGSLDAEAGIFASTFDITGTRLITCEADKTVKIWKEDPDATEETHPIDWRPSLRRQRY
ncbi:hypothetical protein BZG36_00011 [Bifiguratus adelaidae]|uniref:Uncharacterized protein n=1 Tax=Bifiguratus adelaidae TaxID=1938954 RepID=A0A261Y8R2_9FUNG|nr:hypothetical protein BZG36_00011 [Bifiguratus adelaidae]